MGLCFTVENETKETDIKIAETATTDAHIVLHGIIAVNAFISILNPTVQDKFPFCIDRESIFHCFTAHCERLRSLFVLLETIFLLRCSQ